MTDDNRWYIVKGECEECYTEQSQIAWNEADKHPEWFEQSENVTRIKKEYEEMWRALFDVSEVLCFCFIADCHGDAIYLCEKHLARALEKLRAAKNERHPFDPEP